MAEVAPETESIAFVRTSDIHPISLLCLRYEEPSSVSTLEKLRWFRIKARANRLLLITREEGGHGRNMKSDIVPGLRSWLEY